MSQTTSDAPALNREVIDSLGRKLVIRRLGILDELDLIEAAGANADNRRWMMLATLAACVTSIDGVPYASPKTRANIRNHVARVSSEGVEAVAKALGEEMPDDEEDGGTKEMVDTAKN